MPSQLADLSSSLGRVEFDVAGLALHIGEVHPGLPSHHPWHDRVPPDGPNPPCGLQSGHDLMPCLASPPPPPPPLSLSLPPSLRPSSLSLSLSLSLLRPATLSAYLSVLRAQSLPCPPSPFPRHDSPPLPAPHPPPSPRAAALSLSPAAPLQTHNTPTSPAIFMGSAIPCCCLRPHVVSTRWQLILRGTGTVVCEERRYVLPCRRTAAGLEPSLPLLQVSVVSTSGCS